MRDLRFTLDDSSGVLRFEQFVLPEGILDPHLKTRVEDYFLGRALSQVDLLELKAILSGIDPATRSELVDLMRQYKGLFARFSHSAGQYSPDPQESQDENRQLAAPSEA